MAEHKHPHGNETGGTMDITEHLKTWNSFWAATKWSTVALIILAALLAIFRTHNGY